eukprot:m.175710 g.175710  ORF g.175710 m.175710 type:complete len:183 (+) comp31828_c0_seq24:1131-1679(+)
MFGHLVGGEFGVRSKPEGDLVGGIVGDIAGGDNLISVDRDLIEIDVSRFRMTVPPRTVCHETGLFFIAGLHTRWKKSVQQGAEFSFVFFQIWGYELSPHGFPCGESVKMRTSCTPIFYTFLKSMLSASIERHAEYLWFAPAGCLKTVVLLQGWYLLYTIFNIVLESGGRHTVRGVGIVCDHY